MKQLRETTCQACGIRLIYLAGDRKPGKCKHCERKEPANDVLRMAYATEH